jgi:hypothetical protein
MPNSPRGCSRHPELSDITGESEATQKLYGSTPYPHARNYARQCIIARRMVERGVRLSNLPFRWWMVFSAGTRTVRSRKSRRQRAGRGSADRRLLAVEARGCLLRSSFAGEFGRTPSRKVPMDETTTSSVSASPAGVAPASRMVRPTRGYRAVENPLKSRPARDDAPPAGLDHKNSLPSVAATSDSRTCGGVKCSSHESNALLTPALLFPLSSICAGRGTDFLSAFARAGGALP